jgi:hypothetical protein
VEIGRVKRPRDRGTPVDIRRIRAWVADFGAYRHAVSEATIAAWLEQFASAEDKDAAARILDCVEFYGNDRVAAAYRAALNSLPGWHADVQQRTGQWRFAALSQGGGESGDNMLYQFRLANSLSGKAHKEMFIHPSQLMLQKLGANDTVVFLDDFVGTADQVCGAWRDSFAELVAGIGHVYLIVVAAVDNARRRIETETEIRLVSAHELTDSDNLFSASCVHFSDAEKASLGTYCATADHKRPRGYGDCGLVVVFQHRCPNNSIPALHRSHNRWTPIFPRHD